MDEHRQHSRRWSFCILNRGQDYDQRLNAASPDIGLANAAKVQICVSVPITRPARFGWPAIDGALFPVRNGSQSTRGYALADEKGPQRLAALPE